MARVSKSIRISKKDRIKLETKLEHAVRPMTKCIQFFLACSDKPFNKIVADMLHTDEHKIA